MAQVETLISLGTASIGSPAWAAYTDGRVSLFTRGDGNALFTLWQNTRGGPFDGGPESLGGELTSAPTAVRNRLGGLEVFVRGTDNALWHIWQSEIDGAWSGWESLGGTLTSAPAAAADANGFISVFVRGDDDAIWTLWQTSNSGAWDGGWESLGGVITSDPVAAQNMWGGFTVFARGTDSGIWFNSQYQANTAWSGWNPLGGEWTSGQSALADLNGPLLFARGIRDYRLYRVIRVTGGWAWQDAGFYTGLESDPVAAPQLRPNSEGVTYHPVSILVRGVLNNLQLLVRAEHVDPQEPQEPQAPQTLQTNTMLFLDDNPEQSRRIGRTQGLWENVSITSVVNLTPYRLILGYADPDNSNSILVESTIEAGQSTDVFNGRSPVATWVGNEEPRQQTNSLGPVEIRFN